MTKLFVSYAHADSEIVIQVSEVLRGAGHDVWIDTRGIQGGTLWGSEIAQAITNCEVLLLFISSKSMASDFVRREVDIAFDEKKKILPVRIEKVEIPVQLDYQLAGIQYVDYQAPDWKTRLLVALGSQPAPTPVKDTGRLKNPYSSLPVLEPIEHTLILSNREKELKKAVNYLDRHRLLLITGMPGIGKSTFARALLEFMPAGSPTPFWYNFERQKSSGNSLSVLLERIASYLDICLNLEVSREVMAFRNSPGGNASVNDVDVLISFLNQDIPVWLVFDNLETVLSRDTSEFLDEGLELLLDSLKNNTHNAKIIITNPFVPVLKDGEEFLEAGTWALTLDGLDNASSIAFLRAYGLEDLPDAKLEPLVREINGHPFVLNHIAHYIQTLGISAALENLQGGLEEVNERFGDSLKQRLSLQEFNALRSLTILNREVTLAGLCQIARVKPGVIVRLREKGLLQTNDAGKFWLHNIVRNSLKLTESDGLKEMHLRAMNFFRSQTIPALPQSIHEYATVLEWHYHAIQAGDLENACVALYSTGLETQLTHWNEYELLMSLCGQTLTEADLQPNSLTNIERARIHRTLGTLYFYSGNYTKSITYLKTAVDLLQSRENQDLRIALLIELSESYNGNRDFSIAMDVCTQAINAVAALHNESLKARALHLRGIIHRDQGDLEQALSDIKKALDLYTRLMDHIHIANATVDLGVVYYQNNEFAEAVSMYQKVVALCDAIQDMRGVMIAHYNIGDIYLQNRQCQEAVAELQVALEIARTKKFPWMETLAGLDLVEAQIELLELDSAEKVVSTLGPLILKQESPCLSGQELALRASLYWKRKQPEPARDYFRRAFKLFEGGDCQEQKARACLAFARFIREQGDFTQAKEALLQGKSIFIELNNQLGLNAVERALLDIQNDDRAT
ncbi:MAG TPA: tetratricopeptide repeat protein [Anaerolineales bacterium]|nr:tetratricopeptide repeat protein [Anaerolineales bacterium]HLO29006.1 tetratricopeptide repeat protein [Anaerolineales bacterium]